MNELTHDYVPLEMPNILMVTPKGQAPHHTTTHPTLLGLVMRIARSRPKWRLLSSRRVFMTDNTVMATHFEIFEGSEQLGTIWRDMNHAGDTIGINCPRLADKRIRGRANFTNDTAKAYKLVIQNFSAKTVPELMAVSYSAAANVCQGIISGAHTTRRGKVYTLEEPIAGFLEQNHVAFEEYLKSCSRPKASEEVSGVLAAAEVVRDATTLKTAWEGTGRNFGSVVLIKDNTYYIRSSHQDSAGIVAYTSEELPPHVRRAVGMLKLVTVNTHIPGTGVRVTEDTFVVSAEEET